MKAPRKFDPANWERLLGAERRALLDAEAVLDRLGVRPGSTVADIGAGPGFFTLPLAARVGAGGRVVALDVSPEMVRRLADRGLPPQVEVRQSEETRLPLPDASVDLALLAFVLHELEDPVCLLWDVRRVLGPGGRLAVLEWVPQEEPTGPPRHERLSAEASERALADAGFTVTERGLVNPSHYHLVAS